MHEGVLNRDAGLAQALNDIRDGKITPKDALDSLQPRVQQGPGHLLGDAVRRALSPSALRPARLISLGYRASPAPRGVVSSHC